MIIDSVARIPSNAFILTGPFLPPYTREENLLLDIIAAAGMEPRSPAPQAPLDHSTASRTGTFYMFSNEAPSDVNTMLEGSTYPKYKLAVLAFRNFLPIETQQSISGTSAATYKLMEPHNKQAFGSNLDGDAVESEPRVSQLDGL